MIYDLALFVDTNSKYSDIWTMYFKQIEKYLPKMKKYISVNHTDIPIDKDFIILNYNDLESYRNQLLNTLGKISEKYILYNSEDYILIDYVKKENLETVIEILEDDENFHFVKFIKGNEVLKCKYRNSDYFFEIDNNYPNCFSQQASIWKTESLKKIFENSDAENNRFVQEYIGNVLCKNLNINGLLCYTGEPKRGIYHYDSYVFPIIATAITKGKWNVSEYKKELEPLLVEFNIDTSKRGCL